MNHQDLCPWHPDSTLHTASCHDTLLNVMKDSWKSCLQTARPEDQHCSSSTSGSCASIECGGWKDCSTHKCTFSLAEENASVPSKNVSWTPKETQHAGPKGVGSKPCLRWEKQVLSSSHPRKGPGEVDWWSCTQVKQCPHHLTRTKGSTGLWFVAMGPTTKHDSSAAVKHCWHDEPLLTSPSWHAQWSREQFLRNCKENQTIPTSNQTLMVEQWQILLQRWKNRQPSSVHCLPLLCMLWLWDCSSRKSNFHPFLNFWTSCSVLQSV